MTKYEEVILGALQEGFGMSVEEAFEIVERGEYSYHESFEDLIDMLLDDEILGEIPMIVRRYLDYEALAQDLRFDGYVQTSFGVIRID